MPISAADRASLFGTSSPTIQIQMILSSRPASTILMAELRGIFADLSEGHFRSLIYGMQTKAMIRIHDDQITLLREAPVPVSISSQIWRAVRIKKAFTIAELADIVPQIRLSTVKSMITRWEQAGALHRGVDEKGKPTVWIVRPGIVNKPRLPTAKPERKPHTDPLVAKVLAVLDQYGSSPFTPSQLSADLGDEAAQSPYIRHLISSWQRIGLIRIKSFDGKEYVYRVSKTMMNKYGWSNGRWQEKTKEKG